MKTAISYCTIYGPVPSMSMPPLASSGDINIVTRINYQHHKADLKPALQ